MLNFKPLQSAKCILAGIELMHIIRNWQLLLKGCNEMSFADQFYAVAGKSVQSEGLAFVATRITAITG